MDDLINRQAAIEALCSVCGVDCDKSKFVYDGKQEDQVILCPEHYALTQLPSAQPEPLTEIDAVKREDVVDILHRIMQGCSESEENLIGDIVSQVDLLPSTQPDVPDTNVGDMISRQAAIDAMCELMHHWFGGDPKDEIREIKRELEKLPSAQPEIIRCTECKHYREYDSKYVENAVVVQCMADRYPISETIPDGWFCASAERRTDERFNQQTVAHGVCE